VLMFDFIQTLDVHLFYLVHLVHAPVLIQIASLFSIASFKGWTYWLIAFISWFTGKRAFALSLIIALLTTIVVGLSLKGIIARPRPIQFAAQLKRITLFDKLVRTKHSFPSGHVLLTTVFAYVIASYFRKRWLYVVLGIFMALVGWARIYEAQHWPSDIIGSILLGIIIGKVTENWHKVFDKKLISQKQIPAPIKNDPSLVSTST
jgi:undecaprenyl-diphosphatase